MIINRTLLGVAGALVFNRLYQGFIRSVAEQSKCFKMPAIAFYIIIPLQIVLLSPTDSLLPIDYSIIKGLFLLIILNYLALIDLYQKRIPNRILVHLLVITTVLTCLELTSGQIQLLTYLPSMLITVMLTGGSFLIVYILTKGALGAGDVKLMFVLGFSLEQQSALTAMVYALLLSALAGLILIIFKRKSTKAALPFAPFVLLGTCLTLLLGV